MRLKADQPYVRENYLVRFGTGTGPLGRQGLEARTLPLPLLTRTLLVLRERVRECDMFRGVNSPSSSPPSEGLQASPSPDSLPSSSFNSLVKPGGLDDPGRRNGTGAPKVGGEDDMTTDGWTDVGTPDGGREGEEPE